MSAISANTGVAHYYHGRGGWRVGFSRFWVRTRGILGALVLTAATGGFPWWWPKSFPADRQISISQHSLIASSIILVGLTVVVVLLVLRKVARSTEEKKHRFHELAHHIRDEFCGLLDRLLNSRGDHYHEKAHFTKSADSIANSIVEFYRAVTDSKCIGCVIRLAYTGASGVEYISVGRGGRLQATRSQTSEAIKEDEGIPRLFRSAEVNCSGVLIISDLEKAEQAGLYKKTNNEKKFPDDYKHLIAVPLNDRRSGKNDLIGVLTITSCEKEILAIKNVDLAKGLGDILAHHFAASVAALASKKRMPSLQISS